jgi:tetratricopeptide (TPR) repeat protein
VAIDPDFADAWVSLAATINLRRTDKDIPVKDRLPGPQALPLIRAALESALRLDPDNPEALWRIARFTRDDGNHELAMQQFRRAMQSGHNHAMVQAMIGGFAVQFGFPELAIGFLERAVTLDPLSAAHRNLLGNALYMAGRMEEAEASLDRSAELNPRGQQSVLELLTWINVHQGDLVTATRFARRLSPGPAREQAFAILHFLQGEHEAADVALRRLLAYPSDRAAEHLACVYAVRGDADATIAWLNLALQAILSVEPRHLAWGRLSSLTASHFLQPVQHDPRWNAWLLGARQSVYGSLHQEMIAMIRRQLRLQATPYEPTAMPSG